MQRILEPETPDGEPGFADLTQAVVAVQVAPESSRQVPMTPELRDPIQDGIRRNITGPGYNGRSTTAEELFRDYPADAIQVAGKTGTAQGRLSYPWNDSSAFAAYSLDPNHPYTVVSYLEKAGVRLDRGGAGRQVHVPRPVEQPARGARPGAGLRDARHQPDRRGEGPARRRHRVHGACRDAGPAAGLTGVGLSMLQRKPDSGLGNIRSSPADPSRNIDWVLMAGQFALTIAGCFIVFSATRTRTVDPYTFVTRQVIFAIVAAVVMVVVMAIDYEWWKDRARALYVPTIAVLFVLAAYSRYDGEPLLAIDVGPIQIQPAEFAKFVVLLAMCAYLSDERQPEGVSYPRFLGALIIVGIPSVLVIIQPDLGSGSVLIAMTMGVLLVAGAKARYIAAISVLSIATIGAAFAASLVNPYQLTRVRVFFDETNPDLQDEVYQVTNAVRAVGTGGLFGKGWLQGPLTNGRDIPVIWADFPFAALGEQFGLVGCAAVLLVFGIVLVRIWRIASLSRDMFGTYLCAGVFTMLLWQVFQNVGMTMKIMPVTGLPMPFISYGGSSLITWFALLGLVQSRAHAPHAVAPATAHGPGQASTGATGRLVAP